MKVLVVDDEMLFAKAVVRLLEITESIKILRQALARAEAHAGRPGLEVLDAATEIVSSSDHNPMIAEFGVAGVPMPTAVLAE